MYTWKHRQIITFFAYPHASNSQHKYAAVAVSVINKRVLRGHNQQLKAHSFTCILYVYLSTYSVRIDMSKAMGVQLKNGKRWLEIRGFGHVGTTINVDCIQKHTSKQHLHPFCMYIYIGCVHTSMDHVERHSWAPPVHSSPAAPRGLCPIRKSVDSTGSGAGRLGKSSWEMWRVKSSR